MIDGLSRGRAIILYDQVMRDKDYGTMRRLCREDLFFLLFIACKRKDINREWLFQRCREFEEDPNGHLDLWAREHYKSTIITFGKTIQDILNNPDVTVGIFSHTRKIAKDFLSQIMRELENNSFLKGLFPDILFEHPQKQAPQWSLDGGIIEKRKSNPKESTIEAWGLVDSQPTSKHFKVLVYDDVVTVESVSTPEQIQKTTDAWRLSLNLGAAGGIRRYIGTRYHANDTYKEIMACQAAIPRIYPATDNGEMDGKPVLLSMESLLEKRREFGPYVFGSQMLQNPFADTAMGFKKEWLCFYDYLRVAANCNYYILVDPASEKKKTSDYTVMKVIALAPDKNYYLVDAIRDRLNLTERTDKLFSFVEKYRPLNVGYEKYGLQSDIEHIKYVQEQRNYRFKITPLGGGMAKEDRIRQLVPLFEQSRFWLPHTLKFKDYEGRLQDYVKTFIDDEYMSFPVCLHDDMLDCGARIVDPELGAHFPELRGTIYETQINSAPDRVQTEYDLFKE